jgi:hypothetical protein
MNKLHGSTNFIIFGPTDQNLGEVWVEWACIGANQQELTTCAKRCGHEEERKLCKGAPT